MQYAVRNRRRLRRTSAPPPSQVGAEPSEPSELSEPGDGVVQGSQPGIRVREINDLVEVAIVDGERSGRHSARARRISDQPLSGPTTASNAVRKST